MELEQLRGRIDEIDSQMVELFKDRMEIATDIAKYKKENKLPVLDKTRERELLNKIAEMSGEEFANYSLRLYSQILELSRTYQHKCLGNKSELIQKIEAALDESDKKSFPESAIVACQGVEGAYSTLACEKLFKNPNIMFFDSWDGVFAAVAQGLCKYGILPIENSTAGSVNHVYDLMNKNKFYIVKSIRLKVNHSLLANKGTKLEDIKEIYSHEQAITAVAAKNVAESGRNDVAAISSNDCSMLYDLETVCESIQDRANNYTRFICISKNLEVYPGADKTSLMLTLPHKPGSLYSMLSMFYALDINITKLESRPLTDRDFEFMFYFDIESSVYSDRFIQMINELESTTEKFTYLGSYTETV